jgi:hypothetical protein
MFDAGPRIQLSKQDFYRGVFKRDILFISFNKSEVNMATRKPVAASKKPQASTKTKPAAKASPAAPKKAAVKTAAVKATPAKKSAPVTPPVVAAKPVANKVVAPKPKLKLVRDSFTMPKVEYAGIEVLKQRAAKLARPVKKSELLRAGVKLLNALDDKALLAAVNAVPTIKTGRPGKD